MMAEVENRFRWVFEGLEDGNRVKIEVQGGITFEIEERELLGLPDRH